MGEDEDEEVGVHFGQLLLRVPQRRAHQQCLDVGSVEGEGVIVPAKLGRGVVMRRTTTTSARA